MTLTDAANQPSLTQVDMSLDKAVGAIGLDQTR
jgi:hypothetical protein